MTVTSLATDAGPFTPNGVTTTFPFTFKTLADSQVQVIGIVDDVESVLSTSLYDVSLDVGDDGGSVVFTTAPLAATYDEIWIRSDPEWSQDTEWSNTTPFDARTVESALDLAAAKDLWLKDRADRSIKLPPNTDASPQITEEMFGSALGLDSFGNIIAIALAATELVVTAFTESVMAADETGVRNLLGIPLNWAKVSSFGAITGGAANATTNKTAIQAAINSLSSTGGTVIFDGLYDYNGAITCPYDNICFRGTGPLCGMRWRAGSPTTSIGLYITGTNVHLSQFRSYGDEYAAFGDVCNPASLVRYGTATTEITGIHVEKCHFRGGNSGLAIWFSGDVTLIGVRCAQNYHWGAFTSLGCRKLTVLDFRAQDVGLYEGFKFGAGGLIGQITEDIIFNGFHITNCGKIDPDTSLHQEGLDIFISDMRRALICNGIITGCGNGGIEYKTWHSQYPGWLDVFEQIVTQNVTVNVQDLASTNQPGFTLNAALAPSGDVEPDVVNADKGRRFKFVNCNVYCSTAPGGDAFAVGAYDEVELINCSVYGMSNAVRTFGQGSTDARVNKLKIMGGVFEPLNYGVYHANGGLRGLDICGTHMTCGLSCIIIVQGTLTQAVVGVVIRGGAHLVTTSTSVNNPCIYVQNTSGLDIRPGTYIEAEYRGVALFAATGGAPAMGTDNLCIGATVKCRTSSGAISAVAVLAYEGTIKAWGNNFLLPAGDCYGYLEFGGTVIGGMNVRGILETTPVTQGGQLGDIYLNGAPTAGGVSYWECVGAGANSATWKAVALAA